MAAPLTTAHIIIAQIVQETNQTQITKKETTDMKVRSRQKKQTI